ncbi:MAG: acireductone synthase [Cyanobacteriota bacterium]|nr:acireductone synthase [Cyanobacteriota bacterium]
MTSPSQPATTLLLQRQLCRTMAAIHRRGWCDGSGGNFSCVLQQDPLQLLMAPSGVDKGQVRPADLIVVDGRGTVVGGDGRASAETLLHLKIIRQTGAGAVLHTHSQAATLLSALAMADAPPGEPGAVRLSNLEMLKGLQGITTHATSVVIPVLANDQNLVALSTAAAPLLAGAPHGLLIAGHGLYAWGDDLPMARRHLEILEFLLEQSWRQQQLPPRPTPPGVRLPRPRLILLDIEGTTCPVTFVSDVLFPYACRHLPDVLARKSEASPVKALVAEAQAAWISDPSPEARQLLANQPDNLAAYLQWLIQNDRKLPALKELQGLIWQEGYTTGELQGPLFADVAPMLRQWHGEGLGLAVYSSGSVAAQQLLYRYSNAGDLTSLFNGWYDTRVGSKLAAASYLAIAKQQTLLPEQILFVSDSLAELDAARQAGMATLFSDRPGNPKRNAGSHASIETLAAIAFQAESQ